MGSAGVVGERLGDDEVCEDDEVGEVGPWSGSWENKIQVVAAAQLSGGSFARSLSGEDCTSNILTKNSQGLHFFLLFYLVYLCFLSFIFLFKTESLHVTLVVL